MAFSTEFVMGAGGAAWDETPVSEAVGRLAYAALTTPQAEPVVVLVVGDVQTPSPNPAALWVGDYSEPVAAGHSETAHIVPPGEIIQFQGSNSFSGTSSLVGTIYTTPLPH